MEFLKRYYPYFTSLFVLLVYFITLAPSVMQIDTGELATVQATLGIAHPTGYPLFTILGYLFLKIPLPFTKIFQANILAALYRSAALFFFIKSMIQLFDYTLVNSHPQTNEKKKKGKETIQTVNILPAETDKIIIIICTALILAFSATFWQQSVSTEVYSLQGLLFTLILFFSIKFFTTESPSLKDHLFLSAAVALGFTNHMTTLLFIPGLIYLFFAKTGFSRQVFKNIALMFFVFLGVIILVYSYLFIRAGQNPALNWGNPLNLENFIRHVSGKQYQVWMFSSVEDAKKQLASYVTGLPSVFVYIPLIFSAVGIFQIYKLHKKLFRFFTITFLFSVFYTINYSIHDIESYFLLSYIILAIFAGYGILKLFSLGKNRFGIVPNYVTLVLIVMLVFTVNFSKADSSGIYVYEDYTKTILNSVPQNSIVFSYQWDYFVASSYYFSKVEHFRNDVAVIDKELLRRSWFYNQIETNFPDIIKNIKPEINSFLTEIKPFEQSREFNSAALEIYYQAIMTKLISENISSRDYFIGPELLENEIKSGQFKLPQGCTLVPYGLLYKVINGNVYTAGPPIDFRIRFPKERDAYSSFIYDLTGKMLVRRALYEIQSGRKDEAEKIIKKVRNELPDYSIPAQAMIGFGKN